MFARSLFIALLSLFALINASSRARAEAPPQIYLLTVGPGDALSERFGHSALHLSFGGKDLVVSFGAAPFEDPQFIFEYLRGSARVEVVANDYQKVLAHYRARNRTIESQRLNLSLEQTQALMRELWSSLKPPRNRYQYDQLFDNCSTRVRDLIDAASRGALKRAAETHTPGRTFRSFSVEATSGHWLGHWGLDLIVGPNEDRPVDGFQEMYLPLALRDRVAQAQIEHLGIKVPLADRARTLHERKGSPARSPHPNLARALLVSLSALTLALVLWAMRTRSQLVRRATALLLGVNAVVLGVFGLMVWLLVTVSQVHDFRWNENVFLFWPTDFVALKEAARFARGEQATKAPRWLQRYFVAHFAVLAVLVMLRLSGVFTQQNLAFIAFAALTFAAFARSLYARRTP